MGTFPGAALVVIAYILIMSYNYTDTQIKELEAKAKQIRRPSSRCWLKPARAIGGSLSSADLITALYFMILRHNPKEPNWPDRDRFHMSKGHCCPLWYAVLAESGYFLRRTMEFKAIGFNIASPDRRTPGVEVAAGSLGQGLSVALGMSLAAKIDKKDYRVYCLLGDGETQEGNIWEAAMAGSHYKCDNLCAMLDYNGYQIDGKTRDIMDLEPLVAKWQAFGWHTIEIDGHNMKQILSAYAEAKTSREPAIIALRTIKAGLFVGTS